MSRLARSVVPLQIATLVAISALAPCAAEAAVMTGVSCEAAGGTSSQMTSGFPVSSADCTRSDGGFSEAMANISLGVTISGNEIGAEGTLDLATMFAPPGFPATASASAGYTATLFTSGAPRTGLARITYPDFLVNTLGDAAVSELVSLGALQSQKDNGICAGPDFCGEQDLPFTLGVGFQFQLSANSFGFGDPESMANTGGLFSLNVRFFELVGVTPAAVGVAPEPSSLLLLGIGALALVARTRRSSEPPA